MVGALRLIADEGIDLGVALRLGTGRELCAAKRIEGLLAR